MHLVLDAGPLPHDVCPPADLAAQAPGRLVGQPHRRQEIGRQQLRQDPRVDLVGLPFASAIALVFDGFDTTTRPTSGISRFAIASLLPVASKATWSSPRRLCAHARSASGVTPIRPASRTSPSSTTAS
jgi:hypothetical protein